METISEILKQKLQDRTALIGVVGIGYVGLPLAVVFGEAGFTVVGVDPDEDKVAAINRGESYILDVAPERVKAWSIAASFRPAVIMPCWPRPTLFPSASRHHYAKPVTPTFPLLLQPRNL
jgi:hypothetical protein